MANALRPTLALPRAARPLLASAPDRRMCRCEKTSYLPQAHPLCSAAPRGTDAFCHARSVSLINTSQRASRPAVLEHQYGVPCVRGLSRLVAATDFPSASAVTWLKYGVQYSWSPNVDQFVTSGPGPYRSGALSTSFHTYTSSQIAPALSVLPGTNPRPAPSRRTSPAIRSTSRTSSSATPC